MSVMTKEHREAISKAMKGHIVSEETKAKLKEKLTGNKNRVGLKQSEATKKKISEAMRRKALERKQLLKEEANKNI